jgi:hypothetical protein
VNPTWTTRISSVRTVFVRGTVANIGLLRIIILVLRAWFDRIAATKFGGGSGIGGAAGVGDGSLRDWVAMMATMQAEPKPYPPFNILR